ncbi:hypothetical protein [uncultured Methylovirgula sp.]|uniref:hypothetical protein n=1 Tax=uncultured Methylovirgula sp. TaxID=1285960 RepID=UPI00260583D8|nr:hypothetical protein [uncultured Methylovirgula sp.]
MTEKFNAISKDPSPRDAQKGGQGALSQEHPEVALKEHAVGSNEGPIPSREVSGGLTADQIDVLCKIGEGSLFELERGKAADLESLRSKGYIVPSHGSRFKLTDKGLHLLGKRGVGLNEA